MTSFQLTVDCADPRLMTQFWATALDYEIQPPPEGFGTWNDYWRHVGVPEAELDQDHDSADSLVDPAGHGPRIWFQKVPEAKAIKNRMHLDLNRSGGRSAPLAQRRERVLAEEARLVQAGASRLRVLEAEGLDHFGVVLADPEGNEFCIN